MLQSFWPILVTLFIVIDPIGLVPLFISVTARLDDRTKNAAIFRAVVTAFGVLLGFIVAGKALLDMLGVSPGAFYIAGGAMLFLVALEMLFGKPKRSKTSEEERPPEDDGEDASSVAIFPLAIPMLSGPGAITTIIIYMSGTSHKPGMMVMLTFAAALTLAAAAGTMKLSGALLKALGRSGVSVIERIMGMLLSGMAVQFIYDGLIRLGVFVGV